MVRRLAVLDAPAGTLNVTRDRDAITRTLPHAAMQRAANARARARGVNRARERYYSPADAGNLLTDTHQSTDADARVLLIGADAYQLGRGRFASGVLRATSSRTER